MSITRSDLKNLKRILVKIGTSCIIHSDGSVALGRLGNLVEQLCYFRVCAKIKV
jgi:glutamate 5-kinase